MTKGFANRGSPVAKTPIAQVGSSVTKVSALLATNALVKAMQTAPQDKSASIINAKFPTGVIISVLQKKYVRGLHVSLELALTMLSAAQASNAETANANPKRLIVVEEALVLKGKSASKANVLVA